MQNLSYENEFHMQFHFHANQSHFHMNGFALTLALTQRHKGTPKVMGTKDEKNSLVNRTLRCQRLEKIDSK